MVTLRSASVSVLPVALKATWVALGGTGWVAGKSAVLGFEPNSATWVPPGAGPLRVIVPVEVWPALIGDGESVKALGDGGCTVSWAGGRLATPRKATMLAWLLLVTGSVLTEKVALVEFAGTVTLAGTVAIEVLVLWSVTTKPAGAGPLSWTVPCGVGVTPPVTLVGLSVSCVSAGGCTVRVVVRSSP